ncbi:unnamed protein product [Prunus brigantina]
MEEYRRCLERQERERNERNRRADEINELQRQVDEQVLIAVAMEEEENQNRRRGSQVGCRRNVDRHRHSRGKNLLEDYFIPTALYSDVDFRRRLRMQPHFIILEAVAGFDTWVWHAFFGVAGAQNDLNVLGQSPVFNDVLRGQGPNITYQVNNTVYQTGYYLADGIYPRWTTFVKSIPNPRSQKQKLFATYQEGYRKDVERCFGILQARWLIVRDVYEPDPMNTALTRIYERPMGPNGEPFEPEPLVRDDCIMTRMIDRYTEMQSSYIHERRQLDLMEHLWAVTGNEDE